MDFMRIESKKVGQTRDIQEEIFLKNQQKENVLSIYKILTHRVTQNYCNLFITIWKFAERIESATGFMQPCNVLVVT